MSTRRTQLLALTAGLGLALAPVVLAAPAAAAEPVVEVGWWTRSPGQTAPAGGFAVASGPDAPNTVAAVRVTLEGLDSVSVTAVETGGLNQGSAGIQACATASPWAAAEGGDLAEAPEADCDAGSIPLVRDAEAMSWSADLSSLAEEGELSVVLVPGESSGAALLAFDVRFAAPEVTATGAADGDGGTSGGGVISGGGSTTGSDGGGSTSGGAATPSGSGGSSPEPSFSAPSTSPSASPGSVSGFGSSGSAGPGTGTSGFSAPPAPVAGSAPQPLAEGTGSGGEVALGGTEGTDEAAQTTFTPLASSGGEAAEPRWGQAGFFVVVAALAGIAVGGGNKVRRQRSTVAA